MRGITLRVLRGDELVLRTWVSARGDAPLATNVELTPGSYRVTAVGGDLAGRAQLEIGRDPAPAVRIELR